MSNIYDRILLNVERLQVLRELALIDADTETVYDVLTEFASRVMSAPVSTMSMVANNYQFFKSQVGVKEPWASRRQTPVSISFCQHVVGLNKPLIVENAHEHDLVKDSEGIIQLDTTAYLGMPLTLKDGKTLGSFCVVDNQPRHWSELDIQVMEELSKIVITEFDIRAEVRLGKRKRAHLETYQAKIIGFINGIPQDISLEDLLILLQNEAPQVE